MPLSLFFTMYVSSLVTLDELKSLSIKTTKDDEDALLKRFCMEGSNTVEQLAFGRQFVPTYGTETFDLPENASTLKLGQRDLLEVVQFTTGTGDITVSADDYFLKSGPDYGITPYNIVEMSEDGSYPNLQFSGTPQASQAITGWWGHVENWSDAMEATPSGVQTISGTSLAVKGNVNARHPLWDSHEYPILGILRIDDELMIVTARNTSTNVLTVIRGINGTTEAVHAEDATIYRFKPDETVRRMARRVAAWHYRRRGDAKGDLERPIVTPGGLMLPATFPKEIEQMMRGYRHAGFN